MAESTRRPPTRKATWPPMILGWREWVSLPDCGIAAIRAKIDTGARSSAIHVTKMETFRADGVDMVRFVADYDTKDKMRVAVVEMPVLDERIVRNSSGRGELRIAVRTELEIGLRRWEIDLTLTSRSDMRFRMLIGREALKPHILVDSARSYLAGIPESRRPQRKRRSRS